jgi:acyl carrier protein
VKTSKHIRRFVDDLVEEPVGKHEDPLALGLLDSLAIEQLITHLEEEFRIEFDDEELVWENFATIDTVAVLVDDKRRAAG